MLTELHEYLIIIYIPSRRSCPFVDTGAYKFEMENSEGGTKVYQEKERTEFIKYLQQLGISEIVTAALTRLYLQADKIDNPLKFLHDIFGEVLNIPETQRNLGILIDSQLKFHGKTKKIVAKATQLVGLVRQRFKHLDKHALTKLYKGLVTPTIEYRNIIWGSNYKIDSSELEKVQRKAKKPLP
ncbi:hypothetical protein QYM36_006170 [Artemia franciscana]|uniref:Uncharacterized protein n=1 Tax=Artemia franciscana TaxID=6661 RepID=A0AA88L583_ARTSF|nr:hypothetical protein QYM36_006170 [Artemia franciscana]